MEEFVKDNRMPSKIEKEFAAFEDRSFSRTLVFVVYFTKTDVSTFFRLYPSVSRVCLLGQSFRFRLDYVFFVFVYILNCIAHFVG